MAKIQVLSDFQIFHIFPVCLQLESKRVICRSPNQERRLSKCSLAWVGGIFIHLQSSYLRAGTPCFSSTFSISSVLTRITALVPFDHLLNKVVCPWRTAQAEVRLDSWLPALCDWNEVWSDVTFDLTKLIVQRQACFLLWHQAPALLCLKKTNKSLNRYVPSSVSI